MKDKQIQWLSAFRYVVPADYERWFEELAAEGWHPCKVGQWSSIAMRFKKSEPRQYRYVADMQTFPKKDYRQTYEDFGWEFVGQMASMMVWRREYQGERPESFSDTESRVHRNKRFMGAVSVSFFLFLLGGIICAGVAVFSALPADRRLEFGIESAFLLMAAAALGCVMLKMRKNIEK